MARLARTRTLRPRRLREAAEADPLSGMANLFDTALVFALAFLVAMLTYHRMPELLASKEPVTVIKNPGQPDMEIIVKKGKELEHYKAADRSAGGRGRRLGTAYQLETGEVIYVPEDE